MTIESQHQHQQPLNDKESTFPLNNQPVTYINPELTQLENSKPGRKVHLPFGYGPVPTTDSNKTVFFFDIDNCLYQKSTRIFEMMQVKIHDYFKNSLNLNDEEASKLHLNYYKTYGLAIEGLVRNHKVDALDYNSKVDDSLDLHSVLRYDKPLRDTLLEVKKSGKFDYFWLVTNAYKNHALRVISFLGIGDLFNGLTYCDYSKFPIICKPMKGYFINVFDKTRLDYHDGSVLGRQWFIDDSELNVKAAFDLGVGHVIHYVEEEADIEKLKQKDDFKKYYGGEDRKILILSKFNNLPKLLGI
ncbi:SDT1 [Candida jiufengensis]|uniref:SDT1 n=1 Tax=Candida jiufengensis TaxID=497108 RepID=UPI002223FF7F|nr:SDT1 [Candida jiufengensis]KAI5956264.1 SDT1 [Candida jiufengensis]